MKFKKSVKKAKREKGEFISSLMQNKLRGLDSSGRYFNYSASGVEDE